MRDDTTHDAIAGVIRSLADLIDVLKAISVAAKMTAEKLEQVEAELAEISSWVATHDSRAE
jgi:hypothetical protein